MRSAFHHSKIGTFFQAEPRLGNPYAGDQFLQRLLKRLLPAEIFADIHSDLMRLGKRIEDEIDPLGIECEMNPPSLNQTDPWGKRLDEVVTSRAWKRMKDISAEEGIVASGYERKYGEYSRIHQFAKCLIFHPSSGLYSCPLAMTDGAAKTLEVLKLPQYNEVYSRLTSRDPSKFWSSGQWMTERRGGSDVANGTETVAVKQTDGSYKLFGYKWFSSATDADISLTLARIVDDKGHAQEGSSGLSMFLLKTRKEDGSLNNIHVMKLKNKLGTRSLPTGELLLDSTDAELLSEPGRGVACISNMLNITRLHNTTGSISAMRRVILLARDYSMKRSCFGSKISEYPLHIDTLADMELECRAGTVLLFELVRFLGLQEAGKATEEEELIFRLLTPVAKLFTAKRSMGVVSEGLECFGGQGYIEDTGIPAILRNNQVTPIWEGTTNVLSLDMLRAVAKSRGKAFLSLQSALTRRLGNVVEKRKDLQPACDRLLKEMETLIEMASKFEVSEAMARARIIAFAVGEIASGMLLLEQAVDTESPTDLHAARRWIKNVTDVQKKLTEADPVESTNSFDMVFDGYLGTPNSKL
ncbi:putative acyl-CoA dehydrogenase AidB [Orchesella cincta]|uniref:Putative acyl-CoA dehydrogenase AidB n=1 Tax=Orchesella cincta TaxID=48709 RepID=A0A1D2NIU7_ORCCI|nr:putative acyl-CoA dehydrogenase AidB [Orchesella cincta]